MTTTTATEATESTSTCRPLLLPPPLAQAAHDGTLAQHRVPVVPPRSGTLLYDLASSRTFADRGLGAGGYLHVPARHRDDPEEYGFDRMVRVRCPMGNVGDRVWVKEAWRPISWSAEGGWGEIEYRSDGRVRQVEGAWTFGQAFPGMVAVDSWRHAARMPRWATRTILEITEVRCERGGSGDAGGWEWVLGFRRVG